MGSSFSTSTTFSTSSSSHGSISSSVGSPSDNRLNFSRYVYGSTPKNLLVRKPQQYHRNYVIRSPTQSDAPQQIYCDNQEFFSQNNSNHTTNNGASRKQILLNGWNLTKRVAANAFSQQFNYTHNNLSGFATNKSEKPNNNNNCKCRNGLTKTSRNQEPNHFNNQRRSASYGWSDTGLNPPQQPNCLQNICERSPPPAYYYDTTSNNNFMNHYTKLESKVRINSGSSSESLKKVSKNEGNDSGYYNWTSIEEEETEVPYHNTVYSNSNRGENLQDDFCNKICINSQDLINNNNNLNTIAQFNSYNSSPEKKAKWPPKTPISPTHRANRLLSTFSALINNNNGPFKRSGSDKQQKDNRNILVNNCTNRLIPSSISTHRLTTETGQNRQSSTKSGGSARRPLSWSTANGTRNSPPSPKLTATLASPLLSALDERRCEAYYLPSSTTRPTIMTMDMSKNSQLYVPSVTPAAAPPSCLSKGRRAVVQASTSELLRGLAHFIKMSCPGIRHFESSLVVMWLRTVDRCLMLQGWQDVNFINPANLVFVYMLVRDRLMAQRKQSDITFPATLEELQCLVLTCLYDRGQFWSNCVGIINCNSASMLRLNSSSNFFYEVFTELKNYSVDC